MLDKILKIVRKSRPGTCGTVSGDDDSRCKENVADDVTAAAGDNAVVETEKTSVSRPSIVRKRSYSFSDGKLLYRVCQKLN